MTASPYRPLVLIASERGSTADDMAQQLRDEGAVAYAAHSAGGCLRVATSVGPDIVLLDAAFPDRLERLLRAHPTSSEARVLRFSGESSISPGPAAVPLNAAA